MNIRKKIGIAIIVAALLLLSSFFALAFFLDLHTYSFEEVSRSRSPNGKVDAVLVERGIGVGGANHYWIYLVRPGDKVDRYAQYFTSMPWQTAKTVGDVYNARRSSGEYGLVLRWHNKDALDVECFAAENSKLAKSVNFVGQNVNITFRSGISNNSRN